MTDERKTIPIGRLKGAPWNPKTPISGRYRKGLSASLDHFGVRDDLKIWPDPSSPGTYIVLDGNQRLDVLRESGATEVECRVLADLDPEDAKLFTASFDRNVARYDESKLADLAASLTATPTALKAKLLRADVPTVDPPRVPDLPDVAPADGARLDEMARVPLMLSLTREGYREVTEGVLKIRAAMGREARLRDAVSALSGRQLDDAAIELALRIASA